MKEWKKWKIEQIDKNDSGFPKNLKEIQNCPDKLFFRGNWDENIFKKTLAIVGSRQMTRYGREIIEKFMPEIVTQKATVISGFMYGVDSEAHKKCLEFGGETIAVLGGGLDYLYPVENDKLYSDILQNNGLIISEYEADFKPTLWSFPARNRIVSGLSTIGILIIEAGIKSGSLITAKLGLKQNKKILAIPGPINSKTSEGNNWLIKSGAAKIVTNVCDIFENKIQAPEQESLFKDYSDLSKTEQAIISVLENEALSIDELSRKIGLSVTEISSTLSMMLLKDLIMEENGKVYLS